MELFFKWVKQHLRIQRFYGTTENAVKSQIWIAVSIYVLVAIIKIASQSGRSALPLLQILSAIVFGKMPIQQALLGISHSSENLDPSNQLNLFDS